jgi:uncharacterized membrane protein YhaH (DUF805 family)
MTNNSGNFSLDGRIGRGKYLKELAIYITLSILLAVVALIVGIAIFFAGGGGAAMLIGIIFLGFQLMLFWQFLEYGAKRCHDLGNSGFYQLIPFYGLFMLFQEGDVGANEYGPNPNDGPEDKDKAYAYNQELWLKEIEAIAAKLRLAADQGNAEAQTNLAVCYAKGTGVARDEVEAYAYFSIAAIKNQNARRTLLNLEKSLSPEDRLRGQQRFEELQKEIEAKIAAKLAGK